MDHSGLFDQSLFSQRSFSVSIQSRGGEIKFPAFYTGMMEEGTTSGMV